MNNRLMLAALLALTATVGCKKNEKSPEVLAPNAIPSGFNFATTKSVNFKVQLLTNSNLPIPNVKVDVYGTHNQTNPTFSALTDASGNINSKISVPSYVDTLIVDPAFVGVMRNALALISNNSVNGIIGGKTGYSGSIIANTTAEGAPLTQRTGIEEKNGVNGTPIYTYLGPYNSNGRPTQREASEVVSPALLQKINTSLPETKPVMTYHPDYLTQTAETNLNITQLSDVFITFVHEGAGNLNALGYYTYPTNQPPQSIADIDTIKVAIPNASLAGSGGAMLSGDKLNLGRFNPGTSIGFVLFANGWSNSTQKVNTGATKYFSDDALNPETAQWKRHVVLLHDNEQNIFLHGFEDLNRQNGTGDNDFNDLMFYAKSNPVEAIDPFNVNPIDEPIDTDHDGVTDVYDRFPSDPTRAYIQYFPAENTWGTLAFEDQWPTVGDYDLNDMVVNYRYTFIKNAVNKTVEMTGRYTIRAVGASMENALGIQFPFTANKVSQVTGQKRNGNLVTNASNGVEAGQAKAVIFPFDHPKTLMPQWAMVNTTTGSNYVASDTADVFIRLTSALTDAEINVNDWNPFLVVNQTRGREVHLPGFLPTDKANSQLFGTADDRSQPGNNKYYVTADNWPWALHFTENFDYPAERKNISNAYTHFLSWAQSSGSVKKDWHKDLNGYRNNTLIFKK